MKKDSFYYSVFMIAVPVALQCMLQSSFSIVDQIMIGQLGSNSIAAVGLAGKFASIFSVVVAAVGSVAGIMIAQYLGAKDEKEADAISRVYPELEKISVDYGIMEKAEGVYCIPADFGWNDVGSWDALENVFPKDAGNNVTVGKAELLDCTNSVFFDGSGDKLITAIGVDNIVVVETKDAILVCDKSKVQDVKKMVDHLKEVGREDLL